MIHQNQYFTQNRLYTFVLPLSSVSPFCGSSAQRLSVVYGEVFNIYENLQLRLYICSGILLSPPLFRHCFCNTFWSLTSQPCRFWGVPSQLFVSKMSFPYSLCSFFFWQRNVSCRFQLR